MLPPYLIPANNLLAADAFGVVSAKLLAIHDKQIAKEYISGCSSYLQQISAYHLGLLYAWELNQYVTNEIYEPNDIEYWKEQTGYDEIKKCLGQQGVDLDAIVAQYTNP
jgi:hypothetical protein